MVRVVGAAQIGVVFVPVDTAELHRAAVKPDLPVAYLDAAEPDPEADVPARLARIAS